MTDRDGARGTRVLGTVGIAAAVVVLLLFIWYAREVILLAFAGILVGIFFRRLARLLSDHTPLPAGASVAVVVLGVTGLVVAAFAVQGPAIAAEVRTLREQLPQAVEQVQQRLARYEWGRRAIEEAPSPQQLVPRGQGAIGRVTGVVSQTFGAIANFVIILFLGVVLAATPRVYVGGILALLPERRVARGREVLDTLADTLWWWLIGRLIAMTFIGVATGVGLALLGVPLAFILALLAALLSFVPNVGPIVSAIPAILLALVDGPRQALWVALLYAGVQAVESYVLDPIIDRKTVYLPPALTVFSQLIMALFVGLLGIALATPLAAAVVVLVTMLYVQDVLGRKDVEFRSA